MADRPGWGPDEYVIVPTSGDRVRVECRGYYLPGRRIYSRKIIGYFKTWAAAERKIERLSRG